MPPFVAGTRREVERVARRMVDTCSGARPLRDGRAALLEGNCVLPARTRENLCRLPASEPVMLLPRSRRRAGGVLQSLLPGTRSNSGALTLVNRLLPDSTPARLAHLLPISSTMLSIAASI